MLIIYLCYLAETSCLDGSVRLVNDNPTHLDLIKDEVARGRVEMCVDGSYGTVADESWDYADASVVCRQVGFSANGMCTTSNTGFEKK